MYAGLKISILCLLQDSPLLGFLCILWGLLSEELLEGLDHDCSKGIQIFDLKLMESH